MSAEVIGRAELQHRDLVHHAVRWLRKINCGAIAAELKAVTDTGEIPDAIGFRGGISILVECKTSIADAMADKRKLFRVDAEKGVGDWRFILCPVGMISSDVLLPGWGLIEVDLKGKVVNSQGVPANTQWHSLKPFNGNKNVEVDILASVLRRYQKGIAK